MARDNYKRKKREMADASVAAYRVIEKRMGIPAEVMMKATAMYNTEYLRAISQIRSQEMHPRHRRKHRMAFMKDRLHITKNASRKANYDKRERLAIISSRRLSRIHARMNKP